MDIIPRIIICFRAIVIGQLEWKKVGGISGNALQKIDYKYNIRGWLTEINNPDNRTDMGDDLFGFRINYTEKKGEETPNLSYSNLKVKPKFNGNIAAVEWNVVRYTGQQPLETPLIYGYVYDGLNRLNAGFYQNPENPSSGENSEIIKEYDLNGNILKLDRFAGKSGTSVSKIDELIYDYHGNQVTKISDEKNNSSGYPGGGNPISYDANGNMLSMLDKGIANIDYNLLNLPKKIDQNGNTTNYTYRADGVKLARAFFLRNASGTNITITDYLDGFHYSRVSSLSFGRAIQENDEATEEARTAGQIETFSTEERASLSLTSQLLFFPTAEGFYDYEKKQYIYQYKSTKEIRRHHKTIDKKEAHRQGRFADSNKNSALDEIRN